MTDRSVKKKLKFSRQHQSSAMFPNHFDRHELSCIMLTCKHVFYRHRAPDTILVVVGQLVLFQATRLGVRQQLVLPCRRKDPKQRVATRMLNAEQKSSWGRQRVHPNVSQRVCPPHCRRRPAPHPDREVADRQMVSPTLCRGLHSCQPGACSCIGFHQVDLHHVCRIPARASAHPPHPPHTNSARSVANSLSRNNPMEIVVSTQLARPAATACSHPPQANPARTVAIRFDLKTSRNNPMQIATQFLPFGCCPSI